ncbi:RidA family protein [Glycomyces buryatensis]|uniref:RidA family protein n=1 Tax=Glycomyces buryatensis TaxID=2570927 RepID=A0A4S8Q729_9ACTN|nr:RidA family protein [Glycomyces buryatensis]THV40113.1 RidA family protein [Glycomyces buryatensis]
MADVSAALERLGLTLPQVVPPVAAYQPAVRTGDYVYVSGQLPMVAGALAATGKVGAEIDVETAYGLARICALNALAAIASIADLDEVVKIVKVGGFVASAPGFTDQPKVVNGASDLFGEVFAEVRDANGKRSGEVGKHARAAVGVSELPLGAPVEVELIAQLAPSVKTVPV